MKDFNFFHPFPPPASRPTTFKMLGASFLPSKLRHEHGRAPPSNPGYINRQVTQTLQWIARIAFTHPIHTICFVAVLASTSYIGALEGSLSDHTSVGNNVGSTDLQSLKDDGRALCLGEDTNWKWQIQSGDSCLMDEVGRTEHSTCSNL